MNRLFLSSLAIVAASAAAPASAQHAGDIWLEIIDNRIVTGLIDDNRVVTSDVRVFASELGEILPNWTDEPGFDNAAGTFLFGTSLGFNIRAALRSWDGSDFSTIPVERIAVDFPTTPGPVLTPLTDMLTPGFTIPVDSNNEWHRHLQYELQSPASDGIYLLELELFSTDPAILPSLPFWIVFNQGLDEEDHDAAIDWVVQNLVPAPSAGVLALCGLAAINRRRR